MPLSELGELSINEALIQDKGDCVIEYFEMFNYDKTTGEETLISPDDDAAAVKIEYASQPDRTAVSIVAPAESYNGILIRAFTTDG